MKVKHLVVIIIIIFSIIGLSSGWVQKEPTALGIATVMATFFSVGLLIMGAILYWDDKLF